MTRNEFICELKERLKRLPEQDRYEAIKYYEEYFDEAGQEHEQDVIKELKSPAHIASKILSDYAVKEASSARRSARGGLRALWFTILGIFAAPIAIPLAVILTVIVVVLCIALCIAIFALILGGGILSIVAVGMLFVQTRFCDYVNRYNFNCNRYNKIIISVCNMDYSRNISFREKNIRDGGYYDYCIFNFCDFICNYRCRIRFYRRHHCNCI